ncbi:YciI family protein [Belliella pelovolcani]|uniref:YciI family protein n=1 Tax=Belliella pelovolcani TaxID=529505 RepID=UPI0039192CB9
MKSFILLLSLTLICQFNASAQNENFDAELAKKLGADDYGMKTYIMAFLMAGDKVAEYSPEQRAEIQKGHMANINKLAEEGKLILAGPFINGGEKRGIFVFDVSTKAEAEKLTNTDPAIQAGVLKMELIEWYGSAALMMLSEFYPKIQKKDF